MQILVDAVHVLHNAYLVTIAAEQADDLLVVHTSEDGPLANLEAVCVENGDHCARFAGVEVFDGMPRRGGRSGLSFSIAHNASDNKIGLVHHSPE